jgi:hypothetical protein
MVHVFVGNPYGTPGVWLEKANEKCLESMIGEGWGKLPEFLGSEGGIRELFGGRGV